MKKFGQHNRVYKMHGQITIVTRSWTWDNLIIDCGSLWMKHDIAKNIYQIGRYDSEGFFTSISWVTREEFVRQLKFVLKNVKYFTISS